MYCASEGRGGGDGERTEEEGSTLSLVRLGRESPP